MFYFQVKQANTQITVTGIATERRFQNATVDWQSRWDWKTFAIAEQVAAAATAFSGDLYIAIDNGPNVSPRFDIIDAPKVGDQVSYGFNGDAYPDGHIIHVTPGSLRVVKTDTGSVYYRRGCGGRWVKKGGIWGLMYGHHDYRNPSF